MNTRKLSTLSSYFLDMLFQEYEHDYDSDSKEGDWQVKRSGNTIYIYFQWSDSIGDWFRNLDFFATEVAYKGGSNWKAHRGFLRVWKSLEADIYEYIDNEIEKRGGVENIIVIGYSHGAAIAGLATEALVYNYGEFGMNIFGYGFGCPRFVYGDLRLDVKRRFKRFTVINNANDIVSKLPPKIFGFTEVGEVLTLYNVGKKLNCIDAHRPSAYYRCMTGEDYSKDLDEFI